MAEIHDSVEAARAANTRSKYRVFRVEADGRVGFIAARNHMQASYYAGLEWKLLKVAVAEKRQASIEEKLSGMTLEQLAALRESVEKRLGENGGGGGGRKGGPGGGRKPRPK